MLIVIVNKTASIYILERLTFAFYMKCIQVENKHFYFSSKKKKNFRNEFFLNIYLLLSISRYLEMLSNKRNLSAPMFSEITLNLSCVT